MMKICKIVITSLAVTVLLFGLSGCKREGAAERAGKKIDQAIEKGGQQIDKAVKKVGQAVEKGGQQIEKSVKKVEGESTGK